MPEAQWLTSLVDEDAVIMDNCGFHHGRLTERTLRLMLGTEKVSRFFFSHHIDHTSTLVIIVFQEMKERMKSDKHVSQACTEIATMDVLNSISGTHCHNYFQYCEVYMKKIIFELRI